MSWLDLTRARLGLFGPFIYAVLVEPSCCVDCFYMVEVDAMGVRVEKGAMVYQDCYLCAITTCDLSSATMAIVRVYIVRHGETRENRKGIMQGQLDTRLNAAGERQGVLVARALQTVPFTRAYSSDLTRASKVSGWCQRCGVLCVDADAVRGGRRRRRSWSTTRAWCCAPRRTCGNG